MNTKKLGIFLFTLSLSAILLSGCQTFQRSSGDNIATIVNQTEFVLEVHQQGNYATNLGVGEIYSVAAPRKSSNGAADSITLVVQAYRDQGDYVGTVHRAFRPRSFSVWEITPDTLNRIKKDSDVDL